MFSGRFLLFFACTLLLLIQAVVADESYDSDLLNNAQGQTPCEMMNDVESCSGTLKRSVPSPTQCTCTNVYFNLWGACLYSNDTPAFLVYSGNWTATCEQQNIEMVNYSSSSSFNLPTWAFISLPSDNRTFNIEEAVEVAIGKHSSKWTKIQIIVPVIVGVVVTIAFTMGILIWRSRKAGSAGALSHMRVSIARIFRDGLGTSKIRTGRRDNEWVIDRPADGELEMLSNSSRRSTGHIRLSSSSSGHLSFVDPTSTKTTWALPGKRLWKNSQLGQKIRRTIILLPIPWRSTPVSVKPILPSRRFEIDASSERTRTDSTLENFRRAGFRVSGTRTATTDRATSRYDYHEPHETIYEDGEDGDESDLDLEGLNIDNEREQLITRDSDFQNNLNEVMLISQTGEDFTMHSSTESPVYHIPPSPARPRSDSPVQPIPPPPRAPARDLRRASRRTPPAPTYPAPLPPTTTTSTSSVYKVSNKSFTESATQSSTVASSTNLPSRSPQRRHLPLPTPPGSRLKLPTSLPPSLPSILRSGFTSEPISTPGPPTIPPRPPLEYALAHTHKPSMNSLRNISSPPYRSSPLPEEMLIERSDSPPPPPSDESSSSNLGALSPPYTATTISFSDSDVQPPWDHNHNPNQHQRALPTMPGSPPLPGLPLPMPPPFVWHQERQRQSHHQRLMSLPLSAMSTGSGPGPPSQSGLADHPGYSFESTLAPRTHFRNFSVDSLTMYANPNPDVDDSPVDPRLLFPGVVRAAGYMPSPYGRGPGGAEGRGGTLGASASDRDLRLRVQQSYESFQSASASSYPHPGPSESGSGRR